MDVESCAKLRERLELLGDQEQASLVVHQEVLGFATGIGIGCGVKVEGSVGGVLEGLFAFLKGFFGLARLRLLRDRWDR